MAAMLTPIDEYSNNGNSRTFVTAGHTMAEPELIIQKRRAATGTKNSTEQQFDVVFATKDVNGEVMNSKVLFSCVAREPVGGTSATFTAARDLFRDMVASDEWAASLASGKFLK